MNAKPEIKKLTILTAILAATVHCQGAGVEAFDYAAGGKLTNMGSASDSGFSGLWYSADFIDIVEGSLNPGSYPVLPTAGNRVFWNTDRGFRNLDKVYSGETDETLYISFLNKESTYIPMVYHAFELFNGGTADKTNRVFALGALQNDSNNIPGGPPYYERVTARMNNIAETVQYLGDRDQSSPVEFYVMKIELKAADADVISIWRNPTSSNLGEPTAVVTDLPEYPLIFDRIALSAYDNPDQLGFKMDYDEIRIGSTLADVMSAEAATWFGYPVMESGWVDTGSWLGMVNVAVDPWIWSTALNHYIYISDDSGWVYVPR
jgi:hypothetical protein